MIFYSVYKTRYLRIPGEIDVSLDFKPVRSNLGKQVFEYMLENIYRLNIPPGSRLGVGEIADQLGVSVTTVRTHIQHIYDKLGVHSRDGVKTRIKDLL